MDLFQQLTGKTLDDMKAEMREQAEKRVKFNLILSEIVKAENIEVSDDEVDDEIKAKVIKTDDGDGGILTFKEKVGNQCKLGRNRKST